MSFFSKAVLAKLSLVCSVIPGIAQAEFCDAQSNKDAYSQSSQWVAPVVGGAGGQFLYREADLLQRGNLSDIEQALLAKVVANLDDAGTQLAIVVPIPRVLTADIDDLPAEEVFASYSALIAQLNEVGAYAPNLAAMYQQDQHSGVLYNLFTDTHWSPEGTLYSGLALRAHLEQNSTFEIGDLGTSYGLGAGQQFELLGAYALAVSDVCGINLPPEVVTFPSVQRLDDSLSANDLLFGDAGGDLAVTLVGTSFSNKGNKDRFLWADAVRYALQTDVTNLGIEGGGVGTSFLHFLLNGEMQNAPDLLVWESPWVSRRSGWEDELRQIYGTLHGACVDDGLSRTVSTSLPVTGEWTTLFDGLSLQDLLTFNVEGLATGRLQVRTTYSNGQTRQFMFTRSDRLPNAIDHPAWTVFLGDTDLGDFDGTPTAIEVKVPGQTSSLSIQAAACSSLF
jgi:hypothetical protein